MGAGCHAKAEYFDNEKGAWINVDDHPTADSCINDYASVFFDNGFFIIGGVSRFDRDNYFDAIYRLDESEWNWSEVGRLNSGRIYHQVIFIHRLCRNKQ